MKRALALSVLLVSSCGGGSGGDDGGSGPAAVGGSVETGLPKLTVQGTTFRDPQGRTVFLRGANYSHRTKSKPFWTWQKPEHFDQLRDWGYNVVRYLLLWECIEPQPGQIDSAYLDHVEQVIQWAAARGIYVLLDMHQDLYSYVFGGDGAPKWACVDDLMEPNLKLTPWFLTYFTPEVIASFNKFWNDAGLQGHYIASWKAVAERAKSHPNVLGYDLFNEPFPGWKWPWDFEGSELTKFYAKVSAAIRAVDPAAVIFLEPASVTANEGVPTNVKAPPNTPVAYAPHFYDPLLLTGAGYSGKWLAVAAYNVMNTQAAAMGGPLFVGEFGTLRDLPQAVEAMRDQCDILDSLLCAGWAYWDFNPDPETNQALEVDHMSLIQQGKEHPAMDYLVRPYPRAVSGTVKSFKFDPAEKSFTLSVIGADAGVPTAIYLPPRHFLTFAVQSSGTWTFDAATSTLYVMAAGTHTVVVKKT